MKRQLIISLLVPIALGAVAREKMDLGSQARLRHSLSGFSVSKKGIRRALPEAQPMLKAFVTLADGADISELRAIEGISVTSSRGNIATVECSVDALDALEKSQAVKSVSLERQLSAKMDRVREVSHIDEVHSGTSLDRAYTGAGVVAGIVDGGFDPNHVNFRNEDGSSRISQFTYYRLTQQGSRVEEKYDADYIPNIDTEDDENYHGTHTLGIMAGSYRGPVRAVVTDNSSAGSVKEIDNPYYGVAYGTDLAVACGATSDYYVALGVESILDYAYSQNKPAVINLSLGNNLGPHDGSSTMCRYLDAVSEADRVVICVAAGNEGNLPIAINKRFTTDDPSVGSFLYPNVVMPGYQNVRYGQTYIYSDSEEPFQIQAIIVNASRNAVAMRMPLDAAADASRYWVSSSEYQEDESDIISEQLGRYLTGYVGLGTAIDPDSGRFYAVLDCMAWDNTAGSNANGNYILGFIITGKEGQRVDVFIDGLYNTFSSYGLAGYADGSADGSISDVATGFNTVAVGSYNTRDDWSSLDGNLYGYQGMFPSGKISSFSSWGTLGDGRQLPTVCAPGAAVISSSNEYYLEAYGIGDESRQASLAADGRTYSWHQSIGTSMATPVVSGTVALWLEANPDLTFKDVHEIIAESSRVDEDVESGNAVQWGAGKLDALAGLKLALERSSVVSDPAAPAATPLVIPAGGGRWSATLAGSVSSRLDVFDVMGAVVASAYADGPTVEVDLSGITPGVYLFSVNGGRSAKVYVK